MSIGNDYPVILLGHTGMLGHVVKRYLIEQGHSVIVLNNRINNIHDVIQLYNDIRNFVKDKNYLVPIINCIGIVKNKADINPYLTFLINAYLPKVLSSIKNAKLIHISTDCVFNGKKGPYNYYDKPDAEDLYGISKALGEYGGIILRTSIIGPENTTENRNSGGLYNFAQTSVLPTPGYINHIWSGVTTLELAKVIHQILIDKLVLLEKIYHVRSDKAISKYNLLKLINPDIDVYPEQTPVSINRELLCCGKKLVRKDIEKQIEELKEWYYVQ